jgi:hypothetical protein
MVNKTISGLFNAQNNVLATYDYTDIAEGRGVILFKAFTSDTEGTTGYHLGTEDIYSSDIETVSTNFSTTEWVKVLEKDFDLPPFNLPRTIKGTAIINTCFCVTNAGGLNSTKRYAYLIFKIRKYSGSTELEIASGQTASVPYSGVESGCAIRLVSIPITIPQTHFKKGDVLRLTIEGWGKVLAIGSNQEGKLYIATDPMNRDGARIKPSSDDPTSITKLNLYLPFKLDEIGL